MLIMCKEQVPVLGYITSYNVNGLKGDQKRVKILKWLKSQFKGIIMIQESHSTDNLEKNWEKNIGHQFVPYFSHGDSNSRGVVTFIPKHLNKYVTYSLKDNKGRVLVIQITLGENIYSLFNIYLANQDNPKEQIELLNHINTLLDKFSNTHIILGGDLNIVLNPQLDKWNADPKDKPGNPALELLSIMKTYHLVDAWRLRNPTTRRFTWRRKSPPQQSRIDLLLVSEELMFNITKLDIKIGLQSDHSPITMNVEGSNTERRGRGYWKMNNSLLEDPEYTEMMSEYLSNYEVPNEKDQDARLSWDVLKMEIRRETVIFSVRRARKIREYRDKLLEDLQQAEINLDKGTLDDEELLQTYNSLKEEWESSESERLAGAILRSKAIWVEEGEKNTQYFLNLEKYNQQSKHITTLLTETDTCLTQPVEVLNYIRDYFTRVYSPNVHNDYSYTENFVSAKTMDESDKLLLDNVITEQELAEALSCLPVNKTPGLDGLTVEFYKYFWNYVKTPLLNCLQTSFDKEQLSLDQRRGVVTLIPKPGKDLRYLKNWRPVTVLNVDYKLLTKTLADRLKFVLPDIIHEDQCGYVMGRLIGQNIRIVQDLIEFTKLHNIEGFLIFLDFEKAFDTLSWDFIQHTLNVFKFGENFIKWIKILYTNITSSVTNNGHMTQHFNLFRGIRQGCPISAYIFILCAELLSIRLRECSDIKGITIGKFEYKTMQFADDTVLVLKDYSSISKALMILKNLKNVQV